MCPPQLKNENNLLPLSTAEVKTLAVIGWGANDTYAPLVTHPNRLSVAHGLTTDANEVAWSSG